MSRAGRVEYVAVGDATGIELPDFKRVRGGTGRLRGLRFIHTHLSGEGLTSDDLTDLSLLHLDASVAIMVGDDGLPRVVDYASLRPPDGSEELVERHERVHPGRLDFDFLEWIDDLEERFGQAQRGITIQAPGERAVLVGVTIGRDLAAEERLEEMRELANTAGVSIVECISQRRAKPDPR